MCLTSAALAYCTIARHGISETEMQELLSLDDDALADSYEWCVPLFLASIYPPLLRLAIPPLASIYHPL